MTAAPPTTADVVIIGAGPVGLFAVFQAGMLGLRCHVVDALDAIGGQCTALYPEKPIYDIPGFPAVEAAHLIERLAEQAQPFAPVYHLGQTVTGVAAHGDGSFTVTTSKGTVLHGRSVIIAAGCGAFGPNRPPLAGLEDFEGTSVFYAIQRKEAFRNQHVVIAGGGDSALDWAIALQPIAARVSLVHRRPKFRGAPESIARLHRLAEQGALDVVTPYQLEGLEGTGGNLTGVRIATLDGEVRTLRADVLLPFFGLSMDLGPIADWGLNVDEKHIRVDAATCQTSTPGIYAIGDIATYPGKLKLILCGFSEAALATHAARAHIHPGEVMHFEYSTTKGVPGGLAAA